MISLRHQSPTTRSNEQWARLWSIKIPNGSSIHHSLTHSINQPINPNDWLRTKHELGMSNIAIMSMPTFKPKTEQVHRDSHMKGFEVKLSRMRMRMIIGSSDEVGAERSDFLGRIKCSARDRGWSEESDSERVSRNQQYSVNWESCRKISRSDWTGSECNVGSAFESLRLSDCWFSSRWTPDSTSISSSVRLVLSGNDHRTRRQLSELIKIVLEEAVRQRAVLIFKRLMVSLNWQFELTSIHVTIRIENWQEECRVPC
jgi:hypothetical protein